MSEPGSRRGRVHDAEGAREAILNAAEKVFAEHGFDGARIDAIAATAGYNKSLLFHYYGDKLGLYTAVLKRIDQQGNELQARVIEPLLNDEGLTSDRNKFRTFLETIIHFIFDILIEHPHMLRMFAWEAAEGGQTYKKIVSQFNMDDLQLLKDILNKAQQAGLVRSEMDPIKVFSIAYSTCLAYFTYTPLLEATFSNEDLTSPEALVQARKIIVEFVVHGIMADPREDTTQQ